jgi:ribosomal protein S18 acetylase RimI-like enzyme
MEIKKKEIEAKGIRFSAEKEGREIARAYLYIMRNDLHEKPFGLMEDVYVDEAYRNVGYGVKVIRQLIEEAKQRGCYKLIATSRHSRTGVHDLYKRLGFKEQGLEFRIDF